jgi:haloacetate dehalogenase
MSTPDPIDVTHGTAEVNGTVLHYVTSGPTDAPTVVLVSGLFQTWRQWRFTIPAFAEKYRVVAIEPRGYGQSGKHSEISECDKGTQAADIAALVGRLGLPPFLLIGHDRGGRIARRYALDYPRTLRGLALLDILPTEYIYQELTAGEAASHHWDQLFHLAKGISETVFEKCIVDYIDHFYNRSAGFRDLLIADGTYEAYKEAILAPGAAQAVLNDYRAAFTIDVPRYRAEIDKGIKIEVPTLVMWGARGNVGKQAAEEIWSARVADLQWSSIPDSGHYLPEEAPDAVNRELLEFASRTLGG